MLHTKVEEDSVVANLYEARLADGSTLYIEGVRPAGAERVGLGKQVESYPFDLQGSFTQLSAAVAQMARGLQAGSPTPAELDLVFAVKLTERGHVTITNGTEGSNFQIKYRWRK
jgi:hypothetical protein